MDRTCNHALLVNTKHKSPTLKVKEVFKTMIPCRQTFQHQAEVASAQRRSVKLLQFLEFWTESIMKSVGDFFITAFYSEKRRKESQLQQHYLREVSHHSGLFGYFRRNIQGSNLTEN